VVLEGLVPALALAQTFIAGLSADAMIAPWVIKGAVDGATFAAYVEKVLVFPASHKIPKAAASWHDRRMRRTDICLYLGPADRAELQALLTNRNTPRKLVWRADIVLATADGRGTVEIMRRTGMSKPTVWRWQERYLDEGVPGLKRDKTRSSRVPPLPMETRLKVIAKTVQETPPNATHWSRALMAEAMGISPSSVGRIWAEAGLKPHLTKGFKG